MLSTFIPPYSATVISNLENAGCISVGKTNMDEFAMGSSNETSFYGNVENPWGTNLVPGGSSGGSASAVASGIVLSKLDNEVVKVFEESKKYYESLGAEFIEISLPNISLSVPTYYVVAPAECSSNLSRFDGVKFGKRCENPKNLEDLYIRTRSEGFGDEVKRRILIGSYVLSAGFYDAYYKKAQQVRRLIKNDFDEAFLKVDVLMSPTTRGAAFEAGSKGSDPIQMYLEDLFTIPANLAGLPALSIPNGFVDSKPIGLQLIGNFLEESKLLQFAHSFQQITDFHLKTPSGENI